MSEPVQIGFQELYDKLESLDDKFDKHVVDNAVKIALLEREVTFLRTDRDQERGRKWQMNVAQAGWLVSLIIAVGGWVVRA